MLPKRQQLEDRLKELTHQADIMVFMKGAPQVSAYLRACHPDPLESKFLCLPDPDLYLGYLKDDSPGPGKAAQRVSGHLGPRISWSGHHLELPFAFVSGMHCEMPSQWWPASVPVVFYSSLPALSVRRRSFSLLGAVLES
jgi:hypothetical protein